jgi:hypothetical protein
MGTLNSSLATHASLRFVNQNLELQTKHNFVSWFQTIGLSELGRVAGKSGQHI